MRRFRSWSGIVLVVVAVLYVVAAVALFRRAPPDAYFDTNELRALALQPLWSMRFFGGIRPPGYALLLKAFGPASPWLLRLQLGLHVTAWALVAWGLQRRCQTAWVRIVCFAVVLAGSLSTGLFEWTHAYSTESTSMTLLLLPIGLLLVLVPGPPRPLWLRIAAIAIGCLSLLQWVMTRDLDAAWLGVAAISAAVLAYARRAPAAVRRATLVAVAIAVVLVALTSVGIQHGDRWRYPMVNVIGRRVLPDPARKARWEQAGLSDNAKVRCFKGLWAVDCNRDFSGFEPWLTFHARRTYAKDLLLHPGWLFWEPLAHWPALLCGDRRGEGGSPPLQYYFGAKPTAWQKVITRVYLSSWRWLDGELIVALVLVVWAWRRAGLRIDATTAPLIVLVATVYPMMLLCWHGDALEMQRHALVAMVSLRVALWGLMAVSVDRLWATRR
jgi:hypothetical protein